MTLEEERTGETGRIPHSAGGEGDSEGTGKKQAEYAAALRASIAKTLKAAKDCKMEFIFRDVYTLGGDLTKPKRVVQITREMIG